MEQTSITFRRLSIPSEYGTPLKRVYYVVENGRSPVIEQFQTLDRDTQQQIKALICKMATIPNYQSPKIRYWLTSYSYGEIKPKPHRFFSFNLWGKISSFLTMCSKNEIPYVMQSIKRSIAKRNGMKSPSEDICKEVEEFFASPPTVEEKAWGLIHDFYHILLTYMEQQQMTKAELAKRLGTSRSAITQMFQKTPNLTLKKMVEIAEAIGVNICLSSPQLQERQEDKTAPLYVAVQHVFSAPDTRRNFRTANEGGSYE